MDKAMELEAVKFSFSHVHNHDLPHLLRTNGVCIRNNVTYSVMHCNALCRLLMQVGGTFGGIREPTTFIQLMLKMLQIQPEKEIVVEFIKNEDYKVRSVRGPFGGSLFAESSRWVWSAARPIFFVIARVSCVAVDRGCVCLVSAVICRMSPRVRCCKCTTLNESSIALPVPSASQYVRVLGAFYMRLVGRPVEVYQYLEPLYNDYRKIRRRMPVRQYAVATGAPPTLRAPITQLRHL